MKNIKWNTRQRLAYIEIKAFYTGCVSRSDVARAFSLSDPAATKDIKLYNSLAPKNLYYKQSEFGFVLQTEFKPQFTDLSPQKVLPLLACQHPAPWQTASEQPMFGIHTEQLDFSSRLPKKSIVAQITQAMVKGQQLQINYASLGQNQDNQTRIIEPHSIVDTGLRWHVRAFNQATFDFRDFVLSRVLDAKMLSDKADSSKEHDEDWEEMITLQLAPHSQLSPSQQVNLLVDFSDDGVNISFTLRRAMLGYALHALRVDTTPDASMSANAFPLVLLNRDEIEVYASWALM